MKKAPLLRRTAQGFTLIELMIVIVILGILIAAVVPRLANAQARTRDTARLASISQISQAMEVYYGDYGSYPPVATAGTAECLGTGDAHDAIDGYLKNNDVPKPPNENETVAIDGVTCTGAFAYIPLVSNGLANNGYLIASDVELFQNASHLDTATELATVTTSTTVSEVRGAIATDSALESADATDASSTILVYTN